jgi:hypothetical protein
LLQFVAVSTFEKTAPNKKAIASFRRLHQHAPSADPKWKKSLLILVKLQVLKSKYACLE